MGEPAPPADPDDQFSTHDRSTDDADWSLTSIYTGDPLALRVRTAGLEDHSWPFDGSHYATLADAATADLLAAGFIEEWLGRNTDDYYAVLAATGRGRWSPGGEAHLWIKFNLRAHHMQAQTLTRRIAVAETTGHRVLEILNELGLPERCFDPVFDAAIGVRLRRPTYVERSGIEERTASRDLKALVDAGLLEPMGNTRARYYLAAGEIRDLRAASREGRRALNDPYPQLMGEIRRFLG